MYKITSQHFFVYKTKQAEIVCGNASSVSKQNPKTDRNTGTEDAGTRNLTEVVQKF